MAFTDISTYFKARVTYSPAQTFNDRTLSIFPNAGNLLLSTMENLSRPGHIGRKISRLRELRNMKQETLAQELGISQQSVSRLEQSETIEDEVLEKVAKVLGVSAEAVKNFDVDKAINVISSTFHQNAFINSVGTFNINPIEKWLEAIEENKKLYERLLQSEREKVEILKSK